MAISITTNLSALKAQRQLAHARDEADDTREKIAAGTRITKASDDAAGLSLLLALKASIRIATIAIRNTNDGMSLVALADSALGESSNILVRMAELAEQSCNGIYSNVQRSSLEYEFMALASEIDRIAATTVFNGIRPLIRGALVALQVGFDGRSTSQISFLTSISGGTTEDLWLSDATHILYSLNADTEANSIRCSQTTLEAVKRAIENIGQRRGELGAINNRLEVAVRNTASTREVLSGAAAAINDLDVARATANLARLMILQQAGAAILAQANIAPKLALELLA